MHGKYFGNNHTISGIYIDNYSLEYQGLFGCCSTAEIKDLGIINSYIKGKNYVGGIVGYVFADYSPNECYITNCYTKANIAGESSVGGIVGNGKFLTIESCYNAGVISATSSSSGGICGYIADTNIIKSHNDGIVKSTNSSVGGIVGRFINGHTKNRYVSDCYNNGIVNGIDKVGGIVGDTSDTSNKIIKSYNINSVSGVNDVGGICGYNKCTIQECYNVGDVSGTEYVGGITGYHSSSSARIQYTYNVGKVSGNSSVGGIIGSILNGAVDYSYNAGSISGNSPIGGIAGAKKGSSSAFINNCYNVSSSIIANSGYCGGIIGDTSGDLYLSYCYNTGFITQGAATYKGGIARVW